MANDNEIEKEKILELYPLPITISKTELILGQTKNPHVRLII